MKYLILLQILFISCAFATDKCYENLLNGQYDSSHRRFYAEAIDENYTQLDEKFTKKLITKVLMDAQCSDEESKLDFIKCSNDLGLGFNVCQARTLYGFFYLTSDYMQHVHVIFNRWD